MQSGSPEVKIAEGAAPVQRLPVVILVLYSVEPHVLQNISDANQLYYLLVMRLERFCKLPYEL